MSKKRRRFEENRRIILGLIEKELTPSNDIFKEALKFIGSKSTISKHLKTLEEDELIIKIEDGGKVNYKRVESSDIELMLSRIILTVNNMLTGPPIKILDEKYVKNIRFKISESKTDLKELEKELMIFRKNEHVLNYCLRNLYGVYCKMFDKEVEKKSDGDSETLFITPGKDVIISSYIKMPKLKPYSAPYAYITQDQITEFLKKGYDIDDIGKHGIIRMRMIE